MSCRAGPPQAAAPSPLCEPQSPENSLAKPLSHTWCYPGPGAPSDNTEHLPPDSSGELHSCTLLGLRGLSS